MRIYKSRDIFGEFYYLVENLIKKALKIAWIEKVYWKWDENSWIFWRISTDICRKCQLVKSWWMISMEQIKLSYLRARFCAFGPKTKKVLRFFDQNLWKFDFFTFLTKYFLDFWLLSKSIYLWKITPDFSNNFSDLGGDVPAFPLPLPTLLHWFTILIPVKDLQLTHSSLDVALALFALFLYENKERKINSVYYVLSYSPMMSCVKS